MSKNFLRKSFMFIVIMYVSTSIIYSQDMGYAGFVTNHFVDDFGDPTQDLYLAHAFEGTFSNSATTNSLLKVKIIISKDEFGIELNEYGTYKVKSNYKYGIKIKTNSGNIYSGTANSYSEIARISMQIFPRYLDFNEIFDGQSKTRFYIYEIDYPSTNYSFSCILPSLDYIKNILGDDIMWGN